MANVSVRARDIVKFAKKNDIQMSREHTGNCARGILVRMAKKHFYPTRWNLYEDSTNRVIGLTADQLASLEIGFEGKVPFTLQKYRGKKLNKRYFKVGQNVARLVGLA